MWKIDSTVSLLRGMSNTNDPGELLRLFLTHARALFKIQRAIVLSRDGLEYPRMRVVLVAECGEHGGSRVTDRRETTEAGGFLADLLYAGQFRRVAPLVIGSEDPSRSLVADCRSLVAFPLFNHGACTGMVVLLGPSDRDCSAQELCGLAVMGSLLQRADRADSLVKQLEVTCRTLNTELAAAATVQRWLLPPATRPGLGVRISSSYRTVQHAGGDYYDAGELPDGRFGVMIADVSGHGAAAAVLMAILRTIVHDEVDRSRVVGPAALLDHADERLCALDLSSRGAFVTAFSGSLDTGTGLFACASAGHPPPRLFRTKSRTVTEVVAPTSLPLGVPGGGRARSESSVTLDPGDLLVFYSDGITEARSGTGEFFGTARLDRTLLELPEHASPEMAVGAIEDAVRGFAGMGAPSDDQTLLVVRWRE